MAVKKTTAVAQNQVNPRTIHNNITQYHLIYQPIAAEPQIKISAPDINKQGQIYVMQKKLCNERNQ